ncbi:prolyl aminopeptidase [Pandoraea terrae]|uniref:Proline iminopeptidase n=1 Tax=Pandoraea terrae TaxID=1537710 RepID=A0A5E4TIM3_9BURK|nr:alpha/beta fold hydrolase [Pandoraea terrae]VVD87122.1 prolyl aminopeptidase [Pandoraea terrae]
MPNAFASHRIVRTPDGHRLFVRTLGSPDGVPVLVLHGGPGSGASPALAQGFDLERVRLVLPDQRGAGRSRPRGSTRRNGLPQLVADLERIRAALGAAPWMVVGGSWGAALALAYAAYCPHAVRALVLRGTFTATRSALRQFFSPRRRVKSRSVPTTCVFGDISVSRVLHRWTRVFRSGTPGATVPRLRAWQARERALLGLPPVPARAVHRLAPLRHKYRIQTHLLARYGGFGPRGVKALLPRLRRWQGPAIAVHGRADRVCPPAGLRRLQADWPALSVRWVAAGHRADEPAMREALRGAIEAAIAAGAVQGACHSSLLACGESNGILR